MTQCALRWSLHGGLAVTRTSDLVPEYQAIAPSGGVPWWVMILIVIGVAGVIAGYGMLRHLRISAVPPLDDLTLELCRAHGIGISQGMAINQIARLAGVANPAELFLSLNLFDQAVRRATAKKRVSEPQLALVYEARRFLFQDANH